MRFTRLVERRPFRSMDATHERRFFLPPAISDLLDGGVPEKGFPHVGARVLIDRYLLGHIIGVSLLGTSAPDVDLERLHGLDEVWALCIRKPRPGWRVFGRFVAKDCFVGLRAYDRHELGAAVSYAQCASTAIAEWDTIFPGREPHRGCTIADYLGGELWRDVDDD